MKQYLKLINTIKMDGTYKPAARENMPGTQSLFGYQFRHNLADGFPLLTTKKMYWKGVVIELLWFLRGDTNIKYLVDNGVNIWNEDAYQYYQKRCKKAGHIDENIWFTLPQFIEFVKGSNGKIIEQRLGDEGYKYGDCGHQYGKVWRDFGTDTDGLHFGKGVDQIKNLIEGLRKNPESRRHIVTAWDPTHDQDLALTWCHALFQFNCRPLNSDQKVAYCEKNNLNYQTTDFDTSIVPKYYLDCQLYQRSADVFLGVPFNIASYALLTEILAKMCNMIPGEFVHTFGDVHIYDNHTEAIEEQLSRTPTALPTLSFLDTIDWTKDIDSVVTSLTKEFPYAIELENYNPQESIKAELSTGLKK
jgi:thymidylate synthase